MNIDRSRLRNYDAPNAAPAGAPPLPADGSRRSVANASMPPRRPVLSVSPEVTAPRLRQTEQVPSRPPAPTVLPPANPSNSNINITISMPKLQKPKLPAWPYKRLGILLAIGIGLLIVSLIAHALIVAAIDRKKEYDAKHRIDMIDQRQAPTFKPLIPKAASSTIAEAASYDSKRDTYSYSDKLKGMALIVSQQRLPAGTDPTITVAKIAKSMNATTPIVASTGNAYLLNSTGGAQTVVMGSGSLLIFVQSAFAHSTEEWKGYLDTLSS